MKRKYNIREQKNVIIASLLAVVLIMAVGYAAFATNLNIAGTSSIDTRWDVHIKNNGVVVDNAHTNLATSTRAEKVSELTAELACNLTHPGQSTIDYIITVENTGTFGAKLSSINVQGETNYIGVSTSKSSLTVGKVIAANGGTDTVTVTITYKNVNTPPTGTDTTADIAITLNFVQDDGQGGSQTVYAWNTDTITVGTSQLTDLVSTKTTNPYYISEADIQSALNGKTGSTIYNKYTVENDTITEGYACQTFGILSRAECIKMSTDGSEYGYDAGGNHTGNAGILKALQSNSTFTGASGSCDFYSNYSYCYVGDLGLDAYSYGNVHASDYDTYANCYVSTGGDASCYE